MFNLINIRKISFVNIRLGELPEFNDQVSILLDTFTLDTFTLFLFSLFYGFVAFNLGLLFFFMRKGNVDQLFSFTFNKTSKLCDLGSNGLFAILEFVPTLSECSPAFLSKLVGS